MGENGCNAGGIVEVCGLGGGRVFALGACGLHVGVWFTLAVCTVVADGYWECKTRLLEVIGARGL